MEPTPIMTNKELSEISAHIGDQMPKSIKDAVISMFTKTDSQVEQAALLHLVETKLQATRATTQ